MAVTKRVIAEQKGPVVLVGHSYGGAVITEAGADPSVSGLVYITAFAPDRGESVASLIKDPPPGAPVPPILPPTDGFLALDKTRFAASFAADVRRHLSTFTQPYPYPVSAARLSRFLQWVLGLFAAGGRPREWHLQVSHRAEHEIRLPARSKVRAYGIAGQY